MMKSLFGTTRSHNAPEVDRDKYAPEIVNGNHSPPDSDSEKKFDDRADHINGVASQSETSTVDPGLESRLNRKFDSHILPWVFGLWLLAFIDRHVQNQLRPGTCHSSLQVF